jgi:nitrous oxide reductase
MTMTDNTFNRRRFLESSAGVATAATLGTGALFSPHAFAQATFEYGLAREDFSVVADDAQ